MKGLVSVTKSLRNTQLLSSLENNGRDSRKNRVCKPILPVKSARDLLTSFFWEKTKISRLNGQRLFIDLKFFSNDLSIEIQQVKYNRSKMVYSEFLNDKLDPI